jgi:hypothetical protein
MRAPLDSNGEPNWSSAEVNWNKADYWASLQPVGSKEDLVAQNRVESTHISRWEPAADVTSIDRVRDVAKGKDYTVDGAPFDWTDPDYGQEAHWKVFLKRIEGG